MTEEEIVKQQLVEDDRPQRVGERHDELLRAAVHPLAQDGARGQAHAGK